MPEINEGEGRAPEESGGEGNKEGESISLKKSEYETLNQTLGSLKRELKDIKKENEELKKPKETPTNQQTDDLVVQRLEKLALQQAGLAHKDDIELARATAKKWNMQVEDVILDPDFKTKLERQQTARANVEATANIKSGGQGGSDAKNTPEYWNAKGVPPTQADVPDRKMRAKIVRTMMANAATGGKKFYNE